MNFSIIILLVGVFVWQSVAKCPKIISRKEWGAEPPVYEEEFQKLFYPTPFAVIHDTWKEWAAECLTVEECTERVQEIQKEHMDQFFHDVRFNFLIGGDGSVFEGRGWNKPCQNTWFYNDKGHQFAIIGQYGENLPTKAALDATQQLIDCGVALGHIAPNYKLKGHRQDSTEQDSLCPGLALFNEIVYWPRFSPGPNGI